MSSFYDRVVVAYDVTAENLMHSVEGATAVIYVGPETDDIVNWLLAHEAVSLETRERMLCDSHLSIVQKQAIDWLDITSFPHSYMTHPFDEDRLKCVANTLYEVGETIDDAALAHYCLTLKWPEWTIFRCLNTFHAAQKKRLKTEGNYTTESLITMWNIKSEDMQSKSYLQSFELDSMWGYKTVCWSDIHSDVNILVGINGVGKTTLLNAIYAYYNNLKQVGKVLIGQTIPAPNMSLPMSYIRTPDSPALDKKAKESRLTQELTNVVMQNKSGDSFFNYIMRQVYETSDKVVEIKQNVDQLFELINQFFIETKKTVFVDKNNNSVLSFRVQDSESIIDHTQLSSGEKQLLLILIRVFLQEKQPSILLMDEPEISLHIRWQQSLIDAIRTLNPYCQIILTTHSPSILSRGWGDKVIYMEDITCSK